MLARVRSAAVRLPLILLEACLHRGDPSRETSAGWAWDVTPHYWLPLS